MGIISFAKRMIGMIFRKQAEETFNIDTVSSPEMDRLVSLAGAIYVGNPPWANPDDNVRTVNFAKSVCSETARLATLATSIQIDGSSRAEWLQEQIDHVYFRLRRWVEYGCAYGTVFIKPNGNGLDVFTPQDVLLVDYDNQDINGIIFKDSDVRGNRYYTRLEYHRFIDTEEGRAYFVSNRAYKSKSPDSLGDPIPLNQTKWADLMEDTPPIMRANGEPISGPMFGVFKTPQANNVDINTPLGMPIFSEAIEELKDLDVAYSRNATEIFDSEKIILADDQLMFGPGMNVKNMYAGMQTQKLPHYVKNVFGNGTDTFYQEINPQLNTATRIEGINSLLSQIGYKCGFSNGYFVFNESTGIQTATGVEAEQQRTIQFIKDVRDSLESCLDSVLYALSLYADLYGLSPAGEYEVVYSFGDITYSFEEDKATWWKYVTQGKVPFWYYLTKFEGFSEEDAKALEEAAQPDEPTLFGEE